MEVKVSVILPVYNGAQFLEIAIDSILNQTLTDFELIIINDGSIDETVEIIETYRDNRIKFINNKINSGIVHALNLGLAAATGKYIARMDSDDISLPHRLELQYEYMERHPDCVLLGTTVKIAGTNITPRSYFTNDELKYSLLFGTPFVHPTVMMRTSVIREKKLKYEQRFKHAEDYGLWIELAMHGQLSVLKEVCLEYRKHESQITNIFQNEMADITSELRNLYAQKLSIQYSDDEKLLINKVAEKEIDLSNDESLVEAGKFLKKLTDLVPDSIVNKSISRKIAYNHWKRLCLERQKNGRNSYNIFISNPLVKLRNDLKIHAWFFKDILFTKKNISSKPV